MAGRLGNLPGSGDQLIPGARSDPVAQREGQPDQLQFAQAIDQLLGYLTWREGALLLFIRNADATAVIEKAAAEIEAHSCYVCTVPAAGGGTRRYFRSAR